MLRRVINYFTEKLQYYTETPSDAYWRLMNSGKSDEALQLLRDNPRLSKTLEREILVDIFTQLAQQKREDRKR